MAALLAATVIFGPLKLKEIEIARIAVDKVRVESIIVPAESDLVGNLLHLALKFPC